VLCSMLGKELGERCGHQQHRKPDRDPL
jgi:hypothetical protein